MGGSSSKAPHSSFSLKCLKTNPWPANTTVTLESLILPKTVEFLYQFFAVIYVNIYLPDECGEYWQTQ